MSGCSDKCWTPTLCPDHGDRMTPRGRSAPMDMWICCDNRYDPSINECHLWDEHDSTRWYTDPEGWEAHEATCQQCMEES